MSTQFTNRQWRLPNNENKDKQSNYSMDFDGSSYIDAGTGLGDSLGGSYSGDLTVSMWLKFDSTSTQYGLFYIGDLAGGGGSFWINTSASKLWVYANNGNAGYINCSISSLNTTDWYNVICVYKGYDISNSKIYINNVSQTLTTFGNFNYTYDFTSKKTAIGDYYTTPPFRGFNGQIDAVSIFNYELSSSQVTTLYGSSSTGIGNPMSLSPKPVSYYPLGDQDAFNGADYLVPNSSLKDYVFDFGTFTSNDRIVINDTFDTIITGTNFTISSWINLDSINPQQLKFIFTNETLQFTITNKITTYLRGASGYFLSPFNSNTTLSTGKWYNVVLVKSGNDYTYYLNGSPDGTVNNSTSVVNSSETTSLIGDYYGTTTLGFDGRVSNFQIFNSELPATGSNSVETLYNNGSPLTSMSGFTSLQGWWKLDASATYDGSDWTIPDDSSNSNDGTSSGMTQSALQQSDLSFKTSYSPYALLLDGANDYINCGNDNSLVPSSQITLSLWFKTSGSASAIPRLINKSYGGSPYDSYFIRINNNVLNFKIGVSSASVQIAGTTNVVDGNWHNVIGTYDGSQLKLYLDGNSEATPISETRTIIENTSYNLTLGCEFGAYGFSWPFTGSMSNVSIWNAGLTSAQVTEIYNEGVPSNLNNHSAYSNLVSWWQLGSNTSWVDPYWIALDEKGTNNGESQNVAAPNNMGENAIVDGVGSYANGLSNSMGGDEVIGDAPYSSSNSLSVNMDVEDRTTDTPS